MQQAETEDPLAYKALMGAFVKHRAEQTKVGAKTSFNMLNYLVTWKATEGTRKAAFGEMMWEVEWYEFAKTVKCGHMTREEAEKQWNIWKGDEKWTRDNCGPRGYLRLWVKTKDVVELYQDASKSAEFQKNQRVNNKATEETINAKIRQVYESGMHDEEA